MSFIRFISSKICQKRVLSKNRKKKKKKIIPKRKTIVEGQYGHLDSYWLCSVGEIDGLLVGWNVGILKQTLDFAVDFVLVYLLDFVMEQ